MKTPKAIEVIQQYIDFRNGGLKMPDNVELDKALSKAVEVMEERVGEIKEKIEAYKKEISELKYKINNPINLLEKIGHNSYLAEIEVIEARIEVLNSFLDYEVTND